MKGKAMSMISVSTLQIVNIAWIVTEELFIIKVRGNLKKILIHTYVINVNKTQVLKAI